MLRKLLAAIGLLALVFTAWAFYRRQLGAILPGLGERPIEAVIEAPLATGDSAVYASFAIARCRFLFGNQRKACYEKLLLATVERNQVRLAMDGLSIISRQDPDRKSVV